MGTNVWRDYHPLRRGSRHGRTNCEMPLLPSPLVALTWCRVAIGAGYEVRLFL
jgi:hypothetical protein